MDNSIIVLGAHRSGTSALTGALNILGYQRPKSEISANSENPTGFFESKIIARLNDLLLAVSGATWDSFQGAGKDSRHPFDLSAFHEASLKILIDEFGDDTKFVLKDPRICRLFDFWEEVLEKRGTDIKVVFAVRHPKEVARSLARRNRFSIPKGMLIWLLDNLNAEYASRHLNRVFVRYPKFQDQPIKELRRIERELGIEFPNSLDDCRRDIFRFFDKDLYRNREAADSNLLPPMRAVSAVFFRWAKKSESSEDYPTLDEARLRINSIVDDLSQTQPTIKPKELMDTFNKT